MMDRGRFIVFEGVDGVGTTTQSRRYADHLVEKGRRALSTHEPTSGTIGQIIRQQLRDESQLGGPLLHPQVMALLFAADRLSHVAHTIAPSLAAGIDVVCDRYVLSSVLYQSLTSRHTVDETWILRVNEYAPRPDVVVVLSAPPAETLARRTRRGGVAEIYEHEELQRRLVEAYAQAERWSPSPVVHVDAGGSIEETTARIVDRLETFFGKR